jgi:hypothetical protein
MEPLHTIYLLQSVIRVYIIRHYINLEINTVSINSPKYMPKNNYANQSRGFVDIILGALLNNSHDQYN